MAGIEQLEIHSKSYIVRWVKVDEGHTISWTVQPHKKSINFGIVKHPGSGGTNLTAALFEDVALNNSQSEGADYTRAGVFNNKDGSTAQEQLAKKGFLPITWHGKCDADKIAMGTYDVTNGGMFGLVFDNTFSKQTSKHATFVLLIYPIGAPPLTQKNLPNLQADPYANSSGTSLGKHGSPRVGALGSESVDSLHSGRAAGARALSTSGRGEGASTPATTHVGTLLKRRRKKGQGHARRFFSLDYATCTLSYYHNRNTSALRGAVPLSLAAIAADERRREITIDSGAEVWHLKASNSKEFDEWARALERASRIARGIEPLASESPVGRSQRSDRPAAIDRQDESREWQQVEALVSRIVGSTDALRRLVKDMPIQKPPISHPSYLSPGTPSEDSDSYFAAKSEKRSFWKRKPSGSPLSPQTLTPTATSVPGSATPIVVQSPNINGLDPKRKPETLALSERTIRDHCAALLGDLDTVVLEFSSLLSATKRRRPPDLSTVVSRKSYESTSTDEFFDAEAGDSQLMMIEQQSDDDDADEASIHDDASFSSDDNEDGKLKAGENVNLHPQKPKSLAPLPIEQSVKRRISIAPAKAMPPSLIAFVRKNVGKDLSTISMPVSANEPTSILQRVSEQLEYAQLLNAAVQQAQARDRLIYVTAFAISQFSHNRVKERAIRKPFNPLLGETFELVRSEADVPGGFRLLVEKVSHRPVRLAMQADSAAWSFAQSPLLAQKFWGKSAELATEGRVRVVLRLPDGSEERYSWTSATMFLRNVVMGEKYVEPVGNMAISNDDDGARAVVEFRSARGMFGGRGEDVHVETYEPGGKTKTGWGLAGTWTGGLRLVEPGAARGAGTEIWRPGDLVENAAQTYGMTTFAAGLNEITPLERGKLPPTDSRLRPDQRFAEQGQLEEAESWKTKLEEAQRRRRKVMEDGGQEYRPRWFVRVSGQDDVDEVWKIKSGKEGYWEERARGGWSGVEDIFSV